MKNIKYKLIFFLLFSLSLQCFAQKGFKVIYKAEKRFEKGQNKKALKLLTKAEKMDYGFCGNAWLEANRAINLLKARISIDQKEYQQARNCLDSIDWEFNGDNFDSIKIRTYQMEYGKDSLSSMIDSALLNTWIECYDEANGFAIIPLTNGKTIKFKVNLMTIDLDWFYMDDKKKKAEIWVTKFNDSENYKLIKEKI